MPSLQLCSPVSGRASTVYGMFILRALRLELGGEVPGGAGHTVLVRAAIHDRLGQEVAVSGRRGRGPFQGRRIPRILVNLLPPFQAREEVDDERDLEEAEGPGGKADDDVQL